MLFYTQVTLRCSVQRDDLSSQARQRFVDIVVLHYESLTKSESLGRSPFGSVSLSRLLASDNLERARYSALLSSLNSTQ